MKKKFLFSFLMFIFSFGIIYLLIFIYINLNLDKFLKYNIINKKNIINFYKEKSNTLHHLRDPKYVNTEKKNLEEYIFSYIEKNDSRETILFQGDSWFDQINLYANANQYFQTRFNNQFNVINAGTTSYSPSLMSVQYDLLKNNYNIKPSYLIAYIDQTDLGDENCRYKYLKKFNKKKLIAVPFEEYPYYSGMGIDLFIKHSEISLNNQGFSRTQAFINYKIKKTFYKIKKNYEKTINKKKFSGKCSFNEINNYLIRNKKEEVEYFKNSLLEYLNKLDAEKNIKKIFIVTHPHRYHLNERKYNLNISSIVEDIIGKNSKFKHVNFTQKIRDNVKLYDNYDSIWLNDSAHLKENFFIKIFLKEIIDEFYLFKN
jgi:hypothetical protein